MPCIEFQYPNNCVYYFFHINNIKVDFYLYDDKHSKQVPPTTVCMTEQYPRSFPQCNVCLYAIVIRFINLVGGGWFRVLYSTPGIVAGHHYSIYGSGYKLLNCICFDFERK